MPGFQSSIEEIYSLVRARIPLVYVVTHEEQRFLEDLHSVKDRAGVPMKMFLWSSYTGIQPFEGPGNMPTTLKVDPETSRIDVALKKICDTVVPSQTRHIYVLRDMHTVLGQGIPRQLRDMLPYLTSAGDTGRKMIIITAPELGFSSSGMSSGFPLILDKEVVVMDYQLMRPDAIRTFIEEQIALTAEAKDPTTGKPRFKAPEQYDEETIKQIIRACQGLTRNEMEVAIRQSLVSEHEINHARLLITKEQTIKKSQVLEYMKAQVQVSDVGGLDAAKEYFQQYQNAFSDQAKAYGVEPPSGVLLTGVPGTGKSLLAKAICQVWGLPCIRLDIGKVMTGLVGGSEQKMRQAISQAEAIAPCVLWVDEAEKGLSGVKSSNFSDAGTMSRVFGTFLTWMQEKTEDVCVVATANDVSAMPPEFIRRFDEVFFVDLPVDEERQEIFGIHLKKRGRDPKKFNLAKLSEASPDFTGAEIEKAVKHALATAFAEGAKDMKTEHILRVLSQTKPVNMIMKEQIAGIRDWARGRARYASSKAVARDAGQDARTVAAGVIQELNELG